MAKMTLRELARWYESRLTTDKRANGETFYKFKDECKAHEEQCRALALAAHDDGRMLPDDHRYAFIAEALSALSETDDPDDINLEPEIYTSELTGWLHSRNDRTCYCDDAVSEGLISADADMDQRLAIGQYMEKREVLGQVRAHLESELEGMDDEESEEDGAA